MKLNDTFPGAYLISCGPRGALLLMTWLGIAVLPPDNSKLTPPPSPLLSPSMSKYVLNHNWCCSICVLTLYTVSRPEKHLLYLLDGFNKFEHMIGYVWRDKCFLLQVPLCF